MYDDIVAMWIAILRSLFSDEYRVRQLIADLVDDDPIVASEAAEDLGEIGSAEAVSALLDMLTLTESQIQGLILRNDDPYVLVHLIDLRQDVVRALGKIGSEQAVDSLMQVMWTDLDRGIQQEAAFALGQIGTPEAVHAVQEWLSTGQE